MVSEIFAISTAWSRSLIEFADGLAPWAQTAAVWGTDLFLGVFAILFLMAWWRSRSVNSRLVGLALFAPVATVIAYGASLTLKSFFEQLRPCQAMTDLNTIATCDPIGDWSFPSNHAAIAGAAAAAVIVAWRRFAVAAILFAVLEAFSRVLVGAHFPHDVTVGLLVGAAVATLVSLLAARPMTALVDKLAEVDLLRPLLRAEPAVRGPEIEQIREDSHSRV
ncbi:phosphatase PAP2 family protein [Nocardiopsis exhalans]|uniref:Undecaprenyl-diphosphatase n=2 Tax=Nocardiopsis TaxID=2013 RepID=A0A840WAY7_9ACTN|nr:MULTISPECIES: phosphatase PAP2 family protein [Nocardiopsis]MBB5493324.1 undecaprenyl-diphosphatase [Nocardiopsis metallicus]USY19776.1 phosphatase PAP2 family protein [Nocardiopsis exhalans]